ncbi:MAG TPA: hypothetical protein VGG39_19110 [Polyangiaceae bacterium]
MKLGVAAAAASACLVAGCLAPAPAPAFTPALALAPASALAPAPVSDPPYANPPPGLLGSLASGPTRLPVRTLRFDVDALPVATWGPAWGAAGFTLRRTGNGWTVFVRTTLYAEVVLSESAAYEDQGTSRLGFSAFTGAADFGRGLPPPCGRGHTGKRLAIWGGIAPAGWTDAGVDVEMNEGDYDLATCDAAPRRSLRGRAAALVKGYVYAVRVIEAGEDGDPVSEAVVVYLPRGAMVSATADPDLPIETTNTGTFSRLTFPLTRDAAGSASLRIAPASLRLWSRLRAGTPLATAFEDTSAAHDDMLVGVDVAWEGKQRFGSIAVGVPAVPDRRMYAGFLAAVR